MIDIAEFPYTPTQLDKIEKRFKAAMRNVATHGVVVRQNTLGVDLEQRGSDIYWVHSNDLHVGLCAVGAVVYGQRLLAGLAGMRHDAYAQAASVLGVSNKFINGILQGFDHPDTVIHLHGDGALRYSHCGQGQDMGVRLAEFVKSGEYLAIPTDWPAKTYLPVAVGEAVLVLSE